MIKRVLFGAGLALFAGAAMAATPESSASIAITGYVPTVCNAQLSTSVVPATPGAVSLGQLSEFCNDGNGYQVWVDYSPDLAGATLQVGTRQVTLSASGSALIDEAATPVSASKNVSLTAGGSGGQLTIRVVPL